MENNTKYEFENRRYVLGGAVILLVIIFIIRLFILQVVDNDYKAWADSNAFLKKTLYPSRDMPYLSRYNLKTKKNTELWRCEDGYYETILKVANPEKLQLIT